MSEFFNPVPKPRAELPKRRGFNSTLAAPSEPINARNDERKEAEFRRCYGSEERVEWIASFGCIICGRGAGRNDNVHVRGGGAGRKADARFIVPMDRPHHDELHRVGVETFEASYSVSLEETAERFEELWQAFRGNGG